MPLTGRKIIRRIEVGVGIVWEEAGAGYVASRFIHSDAVSFINVIGNGSEEAGVLGGIGIDGNHPFEAVTGRAAEKQLRVEIFIS